MGITTGTYRFTTSGEVYSPPTKWFSFSKKNGAKKSSKSFGANRRNNALYFAVEWHPVETPLPAQQHENGRATGAGASHPFT
jgi:hypothetical protein